MIGVAQYKENIKKFKVEDEVEEVRVKNKTSRFGAKVNQKSDDENDISVVGTELDKFGESMNDIHDTLAKVLSTIDKKNILIEKL